MSGKGGWTSVLVPKGLAPPITHAWARTPVHATACGMTWKTSVFRSKTGEGFLPIPKRIRGDRAEGARIVVAFTFVED